MNHYWHTKTYDLPCWFVSSKNKHHCKMWSIKERETISKYLANHLIIWTVINYICFLYVKQDWYKLTNRTKVSSESLFTIIWPSINVIQRLVIKSYIFMRCNFSDVRMTMCGKQNYLKDTIHFKKQSLSCNCICVCQSALQHNGCAEIIRRQKIQLILAQSRVYLQKIICMPVKFSNITFSMKKKKNTACQRCC